MILADTGLWLALANRLDTHHERARMVVAALDEILVTTWPVLTETCHLLLSRVGQHAQITFARSLAMGAFEVATIGASDGPRIVALMEKYAELPMDLADASLVLLAEQLGHGRILSTDTRDFGTYRWKEREPFDNLLWS